MRKPCRICGVLKGSHSGDEYLKLNGHHYEYQPGIHYGWGRGDDPALWRERQGLAA